MENTLVTESRFDLIKNEPKFYSRVIHWLLRFSIGMCFIGHGAFGIITKADWLKYFATFGIGSEWAYRLMPLVGTMDICLGLAVLFFPKRAVLAYGAFWCVFTALLRPMAGEGWWEFLDRAGNYGPLLMMLALYSTSTSSAVKTSFRYWTETLRPREFSFEKIRMLRISSQWLSVMILLGHAGYNLFVQKAMLMRHIKAAGLPAITGTQMTMGWIEVALALAIAVKPLRSVCFFAFAWKISTEMLYPIAGTPIFEFIERWGNFTTPLLLGVIVSSQKFFSKNQLSHS